MKKIFLLNGCNVNLLGTREPEIYGTTTLPEIEASCSSAAKRLGFELESLQSNHEGVLVDAIHAIGARRREGATVGIVFNPAAFTRTSLALADAIKGVGVPVIEVHISNTYARESFRQHSHISPVAAGIVIGFGVDGYLLAMEGLARKLMRPAG